MEDTCKLRLKKERKILYSAIMSILMNLTIIKKLIYFSNSTQKFKIYLLHPK